MFASVKIKFSSIMKHIVILMFLSVWAIAASGQTEGKIVYEEKMDMHRRIPAERAEMKEFIPQFRTTKFDLFYTQEASKYKASPANADEEVVHNQGGAQMRMRMQAPQREIYKNLSEDKMVDEREFMTKMFLIKGVAAPQKWKITDGQMQVLNYNCLKATYQDSATTYVAWFTPQLQVSNGPDEFGGLPGMILKMDINDGERTITAMEIVEEPVDKELLQEPTKGKEVTREEFRAIVAEKMKEMEAMHGGGGPQFIIRQN